MTPEAEVARSPSPTGTSARSVDACAACDEPLAGTYCHACGERRSRPDDESLAHFLREPFREVTRADGRLWRTLRGLFIPGMLTDEYFAGRRGLYVRPVRIFLVVNILFFFWITFMGGQAFRGDAALYRNDARFDRIMTQAAGEGGVADEVYDAAFGQQADSLAPTMIAVTVPLFALVFALVLAPARRALVRHVVFATHFVAVFMASTIVFGAGL